MLRSLVNRVVALSVLVVARNDACAQVIGAGSAVDRPDSVTVIPNAGYASGSAGRLIFGDHYRTLWTTPIRVPVLSLTRYARGLRPTARGGSMQTKVLHFAGADGREYVFRSVDKDPALSLPPDLRETYARQMVRDLISAEHPAGAAVVARLEDGVGVLHATPQLVVMPNDSTLGEFRGEFAGMLGWIEVRPTDESADSPGFSDATRVLGSQKLLERLASHPDEQVDARAYLAARLLDIYVGDWDRHAEQWRWARFGNKAGDRWQPIPRDRDWALVRLDGIVWALMRAAYPYPQFVTFARSEPGMIWLTWNGRLLDRRFLATLDGVEWDSVAGTLQRLLTDSLIDAAARSVPPEMYARNGDALTSILRWRRDRLPSWARQFYRIVVEDAEVHATDTSELITVERLDTRYTDVTIHALSKAGAPRSRILSQRRFDANETREIRIFLGSGEDHVVIRGVPAGATLIRLVASGGAKTYLDSTIDGAQGIRVYERFYTPPPSPQWFAPPRDWGERWQAWPWLAYTSDIGLFVGGGPLLERYGFRTYPYVYRMSLRVGYATGVGRWRAQYDADFRRLNSAIHATILARASAIDVLHYYGIGNETAGGLPAKSFRIDSRQYEVEPMLFLPLPLSLGGRSSIGIGPSARYIQSPRDTSVPLTRIPNRYGTGAFAEAGAQLRITVDTRDRVEYATRGMLLDTRADFYPAVGSVTHAYGAMRPQFSTYLTVPAHLEPTLALRVAGHKVWGPHPYFDAAFVGGGSTLRGWAEQRFAGDASLYGSAELRLFLVKIFFLLPSDFGVFGLADAGRVFAVSEPSNVIHSAFGGGLWLSPLGRSNTLSLALARSKEGSGVYLRSGMAF